MRPRPSTVLAGAALFFALGGSAIAVNEAVRPQARCQPGAVRGFVAVNGDPTKGMANFPDQFTSSRLALRDALQLRRRRSPGPAGQRGRVRGALSGERDTGRDGELRRRRDDDRLRR